jgi:HTH-type transcriptional regulator/antitoxin HipB
LCAGRDKLLLYEITHNHILCAISDIDTLSDLTHNCGMNDLARDPKQIGTLVRRARKRRDLSQQQLAAKVGLRQETISLIETGNPATKIETLLAVLSALDLEFHIAPRSKGWGRDIESDF